MMQDLETTVLREHGGVPTLLCWRLRK
jgi:hypothetical protein